MNIGESVHSSSLALLLGLIFGLLKLSVRASGATNSSVLHELDSLGPGEISLDVIDVSKLTLSCDKIRLTVSCDKNRELIALNLY